MDPNSDSDSRIYTASDISLMIGGIAAAVATIVYSCKHVSKSSCCKKFHLLFNLYFKSYIII
jgi:hypothetical protein